MCYFSALVLFLGRLGAVVELTCRDDGLRRSVSTRPNSTYDRVLLYPSNNRKTLTPTKLSVENASLAVFYSSARSRENAVSVDPIFARQDV